MKTALDIQSDYPGSIVGLTANASETFHICNVTLADGEVIQGFGSTEESAVDTAWHGVKITLRKRRRSIRAYFLAVYFCQRNYGGSEEGGWYYDSGERKGKVHTFASESDARRVQERAQRMLDRFHPENARPLSSVASEGQFIVECHDEPPPAFYPETRPIYE